ncbi:hypothetical protein LCGC14_2278360, partial [marine sediment metagenome]
MTKKAKKAKKHTSLIVKPEQDIAPVTDEATALIQVIERAARDPSVDIDKMERLL